MRLATALIALNLATWERTSRSKPPSQDTRLPSPDRHWGRKLHLHCSGRGTPTVILVAGGGAFSIDWALVQPR